MKHVCTCQKIDGVVRLIHDMKAFLASLTKKVGRKGREGFKAVVGGALIMKLGTRLVMRDCRALPHYRRQDSNRNAHRLGYNDCHTRPFVSRMPKHVGKKSEGTKIARDSKMGTKIARCRCARPAWGKRGAAQLEMFRELEKQNAPVCTLRPTACAWYG